MNNKLDLYEDIKFVEMAKNQRTIIICFTLIIIAMMVGFFVTINLPLEEETVEEITTTYTQNADTEGDNANINQNIEE